MKEVIVKILKNALQKNNISLKDEQIKNLIEVPPNPEFGDYAFPCFSFCSLLKESPHQIALTIRQSIEAPETDFEDVQTQGGYINFFVNRKSLARQVVWDAITQKKDYGNSDIGKKKKVVLDFSSPNIAKPFGIGHLRSTIIGNTLYKI